jgi:hypothetical protein
MLVPKTPSLHISSQAPTPWYYEFLDSSVGETPIAFPISKTFDIWNTGSIDLTLSGMPLVSLSNDVDCQMFNITSQPTTPIAAGAHTSFIVQYNPTTTGYHSCHVSVMSNDTTANPFFYTVSGYAYNLVITDPNPCIHNTELNSTCNAMGGKTAASHITSAGQLSNTIIDTALTNEGWVSSSVITAKGRISVGTLTGQIENHGIISDFDFKGGSLIGGILSGKITNTSIVGGYFQDVTFTANASLDGGLLQGTIRGNPNASVLLNNVRIKANTKLSGVSLGTGVVLEAGVVIEPNITLPALEKPVVLDAMGNFTTASTAFYGGISVSSKPYVRQAVQKLEEPVSIRGRIIVAPEHIGQKVDLFVYSLYELNHVLIGYYMLDEASNLLSWNQKTSELAAFKKGVILESVQDVDMYTGHFVATGSLNFLFGYRLSDGTVIMNAAPNTIAVTVQ